MPAWLAAALALIRSAGLGAAAGGAALAVPSVLAGDGLGFDLPFFGGDRKRRRRRRRALTASDRADIAFITGLLGATAGKNFALTIATRA